MSGSSWIDQINRYADYWAPAMWRACWQGALAVLLILLLCRFCKRLPAQLRYGLWWCVCLRMVMGLSPAIRLAVLPPTRKSVPPAAIAPVLLTQPQVFGFTAAKHWPAVTRLPAKSQQIVLSLAARMMILWLCSICALAALSTVSVLRLRRLVYTATPIGDPELVEIGQSAASAMGMRSTPRVLVTQFDSRVLTLGLVRPVVLLSVQTLTCCDAAELKLVLAHEFSHISRGDSWLGLIPHFTKVLFCFHPLAWLACHEIAVAREAACDENTITQLDARSDEYGRLLLKLGVRQSSWLSLCTPGVSSHYRILHRRLSMLQEVHGSPRHLRGRIVTVLFLVGIAAAVPWSVVHAQSSGGQSKGSSAVSATGAASSASASGGKVTTTKPGKSVQVSSDPNSELWRKLVLSRGTGVNNGNSTAARIALPNAFDAHSPVPGASRGAIEAPKRQTRLFPMKYAEAAGVAKTLSLLFEEDDKKNVKIVADPRTNTVIIQATAEKLNEIRPVLDHLDSTEITVGQKAWMLRIINLKFAKAKEIASTISPLFQPVGIISNVGSPLQVVVDDRTNSLIVLGPEEQINQIQNLISQLDVSK